MVKLTVLHTIVICLAAGFVAGFAISAHSVSPSIASEQAEKVQSANSPQDQEAVREEIIGIERSDWQALKTKNKAAIERVRSHDYFDFGSDGRVNKAKVFSEGWMAADSTLLDFSWQDLQVSFLGDSTALVTYRGKYRGTTAGKEDSGEAYYSTLYQKRQGRWMIVFTQDSNLKCAGM
jgi:hypothetical protein